MKEHDYLILGGGPAGLQLGYEFEKNNRDYLILESGATAGTFFKTYPRHRKLLSINKVYTGFDDLETVLRWDWNSLLTDDDDMRFKHFSKEYFPSADDLVRYLVKFSEKYNLRISYDTHIVHVTKRDGQFLLTSDKGDRFLCNKLIVATGLHKLVSLPIPGIETAESYAEVSVDPADFVDQRVLIIGKKNSAFETADNLIETTRYIHVASPESLSLAWQSRFVGDLRAVNNNFLDTYQLKCQNAVLDGIITRIEKTDGIYKVWVSYTHADNEKEVLEYDRIIVAAGFRFDHSIFDEPAYPEMSLNDRFPAQTEEWESKSVKDLFFAGTLMQERQYRKTTSSFIHGFRYCVRTLSSILERKYHQGTWPSKQVPCEEGALLQTLLERVNTTSALWQQFGFIADLFVLHPDQCHYYYELPKDYIPSSGLVDSPDYILITLEFGKVETDPFAINRPTDQREAHNSSFLHPIFRRYHNDELVDEVHLLEDLHANWEKDIHIQAMRELVQKAIAEVAKKKKPKAKARAAK